MVTDSKEIYEKLKLIRSHGRLEDTDYFSSWKQMDYVTLGYNYRMSDITAALGISQLEKIDKIIQMRKKNAEYMNNTLSEIKDLSPPKSPYDYYFHVYQMYTVRAKGEQRTRDNLANYLAEKGITTKVYFHPVHLTHFYKNELNYYCKLPVTEEISKQVLTLPMYPSLTTEEMDYIAEETKTFFSRSGR